MKGNNKRDKRLKKILEPLNKEKKKLLKMLLLNKFLKNVLI